MQSTREIPATLSVALISALCLSGLVAGGQTEPTSRFSQTWAVVVGVSQYPKLGGGQQLQFAHRDASAFAAALTAAGVSPLNVRLLTGPDATLAAIKSSLGTWLARSASEQDTVYIYFSGHGIFESEFRESYLLCYDSDPDNLYPTALSLSDLKQALAQRVRARRVVVIADAVRRDFFDPESNPAAAASFAKAFGGLAASRAGLSTLLACGPGEFSREGQRWGGYGVFSKLLVDGISGKADINADGAVTEEEVFSFLSAQLPSETSGKQHPWRYGSQAGQVVLSEPSASARLPARPPIEGGSGDKPAARSTRAPAAARRADSSSSTLSRTFGGVGAPPSPRSASSPPPPEVPTIAAEPPPNTTLPSGAHIETAGDRPAEPPRPVEGPPDMPAVAPHPVKAGEESIPQPISVSLAPPATPLVIQLEAAVYSGKLIEPKDSCAWDIYQRLTRDPEVSAELSRLKSLLLEALASSSRAITCGDVRADNISNKLDDFRRAGQMLLRARSLRPDDPALAPLEKLSAAEALIALQFFDEAERSLSQLQVTRLAAVENALGLVYQGMLDNWRAERAFKRAIELDQAWAAPRYNLALLYRNQKKQEALVEFERAAALAPSNAWLQMALGDEYFSKEKWLEAASAYRKAISADPTDGTLHTKLGHALYSQGLRDEANLEYQKARELRSKQE